LSPLPVINEINIIITVVKKLPIPSPMAAGKPKNKPVIVMQSVDLKYF
jgi:hypothetical protein